mmetsp:Transcript_17611/g.32776  ORF Transcript_17611/g.32776 Transcript_17611/m.32776 type:complete len:220 (-) Transcript_17611:574-1233(-)
MKHHRDAVLREHDVELYILGACSAGVGKGHYGVLANLGHFLALDVRVTSPQAPVSDVQRLPPVFESRPVISPAVLHGVVGVDKGSDYGQFPEHLAHGPLIGRLCVGPEVVPERLAGLVAVKVLVRAHPSILFCQKAQGDVAGRDNSLQIQVDHFEFQPVQAQADVLVNQVQIQMAFEQREEGGAVGEHLRRMLQFASSLVFSVIPDKPNRPRLDIAPRR